MVDSSPSVALYLPSPSEIREACRKIRQEWSPRERASRRAGGRHGWRLLARPLREVESRREWKI